MNHMPETITAIIKVMILVVPTMMLLVLAGWITIAIFIAKNGKKMINRFMNGLQKK